MSLPEPYYQNNMITLYNGDALSVLKDLPDESVNCCVTSPPYWGLRDYNVNPIIWDQDKPCMHKWGKKHEVHDVREETNHGKSRTTDRYYGKDKTRKFNGNHQRHISGKYCVKCGAWKGSLGLEPTLELYIKHMVDIFSEVKRVLKDDGTLWMNLGDCYYMTSVRGGNKKSNNDFDKLLKLNEGAFSRPKIDYLKSKDLCGLPWRIAFALQENGWWLRSDIIWNKINCMPESVTDRPTKAHEYIFLLSKSKKYYYDQDSIMEEATGYDGKSDTMLKGSKKYKESVVPGHPEHTMAARGHERWKWKNLRDKGQQTHSFHEARADGRSDEMYPVRNKRSVWTVPTKPFSEAHFATFPPDLIEPCILAGCPKEGMIIDPFTGSGTTNLVSAKLQRKSIGIELNESYLKNIAIPRIEDFRTGLTKEQREIGQELLFDENCGDIFSEERS